MQELSVSDIVKATGGELASGCPNEIITGITTNSRESGNGILFIPLVGEKRDGHDFIESAIEQGSAVITARSVPNCGTVVTVGDTRKALGDIARYYKAKYNVPTVSVTGSVGKTTTKDMVSSVLAQKYKTHKTPNNFNNDIGVPLTIFGIEAEYRAAVIEMGMNHFGEISYLTDIVRPDCAIITNIGMSHIENLGSREGIFKAKMEITESFSADNVLIVNGDDDYLKTLDNTPYKLIKFGMSDENDIYAKDVVNNGLFGTEFTVVHCGGEFRARVTQPGVHNIYNALSAVAAGLCMGLSENECAAGLEECVYTSSRLEIIKHKGMEIISDCYNSSPDSVRAALKVMRETKQPRRVAVLGDILEMGEYAKDAHYELGSAVVESGCDMLITAGGNAREIGHGAIDGGMENVVCFDTTEELNANISSLIADGDCILVKASHGMRFDTVVDEIKKI